MQFPPFRVATWSSAHAHQISPLIDARHKEPRATSPGRVVQRRRGAPLKRQETSYASAPRPWIKPRAWALHFIPSRFIPSPSTRQARSQRLPGGRCERWAHEESAGYRAPFRTSGRQQDAVRAQPCRHLSPLDRSQRRSRRRARHAFELAFAHPLFLLVDELELHTTFLEIALRLLSIEAFLRAEYLDVHTYRLRSILVRP